VERGLASARERQMLLERRTRDKGLRKRPGEGSDRAEHATHGEGEGLEDGSVSAQCGA
jgi:hypothetical protein